MFRDKSTAGVLSRFLSIARARRKPAMAKVLCVLYDDPVDGFPKSDARDDVPKLDR